MNFKNLTDRAKKIVDDRGGTSRLKEDAASLKDIASRKGSLSDKAKAAGDALRQPGTRPRPSGTEDLPPRG